MLNGTSSKFILDFKAARNNPLITDSPDIDLKGMLTVEGLNMIVDLVGKVEGFLAFEAYTLTDGD